MIRLMGCSVAVEDGPFRVFPDRAPIGGFGKRLCRRLAEVTGTSVLASDSTQNLISRLPELKYPYPPNPTTKPESMPAAGEVG